MSIWNHLPLFALKLGPKALAEKLEADHRRLEEHKRQMREQMQLRANPKAYPFPSARGGRVLDSAWD